MKAKIIAAAVCAAALAAGADVPKGGYTGVNPGRAGRVRATSVAPSMMKEGGEATPYRQRWGQKKADDTQNRTQNRRTDRMRYRSDGQRVREPLKPASDRRGGTCLRTAYHKNCGGKFGEATQTLYGSARRCEKCGKLCKDDKREVELR